MGMRIDNTPSALATQGTGASGAQSRQQGMKDLLSALQAGDLDAAQKAYSAMTSHSTKSQGVSLLGQIGQALQSGDLAGAQKVAQELQAVRAGHHHHHPHTDQAAAQVAQTPTATPASGAGSTINLIA